MAEMALVGQTTGQAQSAAERWRAIEKLNSTRNKPVDAKTLSTLLGALADEHPFVRWQAGLVLAGKAEGSQKLVETLNSEPLSETNLAHIAAADALANSETTTAHSALINALGSNNVRLRQSAAEALAKQKNPDAVPHLIKATSDPDLWVRRAAAYALGHLGTPDTAHVLITCLRDQSLIVRRSAAYALGALRAEAAVPQLKTSLGDQDPLTRRNAAWALGRIGLQGAVPELTQLLDDPALDGTVAAAAQQAIRAITQPRWLQTLLGLFGRFQR
jgi:HEAT repeat protein